FSFLGVALQQVMPGAQTLPPQSASVLQGCPQLHRQVRSPIATSEPVAGWTTGMVRTVLSERSGCRNVLLAGPCCEVEAPTAAIAIRMIASGAAALSRDMSFDIGCLLSGKSSPSRKLTGFRELG